MVLKRIYGVGKSAGNTLWLESKGEVITPTFQDYVTIKITHPNDSAFKNLKVGQVFKRGEKIVLEGDDGKATGYHFHISVGRGKMVGTGYIKNSLGSWVINTTKGGIKPEDAFYIDQNFTTIKNTKGLIFQTLNDNNGLKYIKESLNVRMGPGTSYKIRNTLPGGTKISVLEEKGSWSKIGDDEWVASNYLTKDIPSKIYPTKKTSASYLNVRLKPKGTILTTKAPLPKNTTVAIMSENSGWTKINDGRYVSSAYLI